MNRTNQTLRLCLAHFLMSIMFSPNAYGTDLFEREIYSWRSGFAYAFRPGDYQQNRLLKLFRIS